jgi:hypothetical protein
MVGQTKEGRRRHGGILICLPSGGYWPLRYNPGFFKDLESAVQLVCLDLEGVLVPEIWIEFAARTGIPELRRTTRDEPDYDKLMKYRLDLLAQHRLGLPDIQKVISEMDPMAGAKDFLDTLRKDFQVIILSDKPVDSGHAGIPSLLAVSAVHQHLLRQGLRARVGLRELLFLSPRGETFEWLHGR